jgi:N-acetylglucosamine-6-phosphate deacetylase
LCDAFRYASLNPARLLKMHEYGELKKGKRADIIIVDHLMNVKKVFLAGVLQK